MELSKSVSVHARIPGNVVTIFGYTSPDSRVELTSPRTFAVTYSDDNGYFAFNRLLLPRHSQDLCLSVIDESNRHNKPACFPEPPENSSTTDIGPILLSPTLTLDLKNKFSSGQTIPNSQIYLHFYQEQKPFSFIKKVSAFSLPVIQTQSDSRGNYSINLAASTPTNYRLYTTATFLESNTPKSNTLLYQPASYFNFLFPLLPLLLLIFFFLFRLFHPRRYLPAIYYDYNKKTS